MTSRATTEGGRGVALAPEPRSELEWDVLLDSIDQLEQGERLDLGGPAGRVTVDHLAPEVWQIRSRERDADEDVERVVGRAAVRQRVLEILGAPLRRRRPVGPSASETDLVLALLALGAEEGRGPLPRRPAAGTTSTIPSGPDGRHLTIVPDLPEEPGLEVGPLDDPRPDRGLRAELVESLLLLAVVVVPILLVALAIRP